MKYELLSETAKQESTHWWYVGRLHIVDRQLEKIAGHFKGKAKILNIGSGTGGTISTLEKYGRVTNVDVSPEAISFLEKHGHKALLIDGKTLPFEKEAFDLVVALDVIEHTPNDKKALKEWLRVLKNDGHILITVPAHQWLWSEFDEINNHYRRYSKKRLRKLLDENGIVLRKLSYAIFFSFFMVAGFRLLSRNVKKVKSSSLVSLPPGINNLFVFLLKIEAWWQKRFNVYAGTSLLAWGKKR